MTRPQVEYFEVAIRDYYPRENFTIDKGQVVRIVENPYHSFEEISKGTLSVLNGQIWEYSLIISDSYQYTSDLVVFHSFITDNYQTYHYAENANKLLFEDDDLKFIDDRNLIKEGVGMKKVVDFNEFPLLMNCNRIPYSDMEYEYIDYKTCFDRFRELKGKRIKGISGKYDLYDLICLYAFARSFEITHRMYRNAHLPLSFYITILESLIGKPESCNAKLHCDDCGTELPSHFKTSLEQRFKRYFEQFKDFRKIRHKTFHGGSFFDFGGYLSDLVSSKANWTDDKKFLLYQHKREEMECAIRILLTGEFHNYCRKGIKAS